MPAASTPRASRSATCCWPGTLALPVSLSISPCLPLPLSLSLPLLIAIFTIVLILFVANKIGGKFDDVVVARFVPYAPLPACVATFLVYPPPPLSTAASAPGCDALRARVVASLIS